MKPVPPEYPRRVPDIDFDEDPILPGTLVYAEDSDDEAGDAEEFEKRRAAKRRRVEKNAHAYLRGEGLFLLSAGLRGPFDATWDNPWDRKSSKRKAEPAADETAVKRARKMLRRDHVTTQTPWKSRQLHAPQQPNPFAAAHAAASRPLTPDEKVETWLKRSTGLQPEPDVPEPTSPTPKRKGPTMKHPRSARRDKTPTKQFITVNSQNVKAPQQLLNDRVVDSFETIVPQAKKASQPVDTHARLQDVLQTYQSHADDRDDPVEDTSRAEAAIKKIKAENRSSISPAQNRQKKSEALLSKRLNNVQPHSLNRTSRGTYQSESIRAEVKLKKLETAIDDQLKQSDAGTSRAADKDSSKDRSTGKANGIPVSAIESNVASSILPPSAQPRPELQTSTSNISSGVLLLNQPPSQVNEIVEHVPIRSSGQRSQAEPDRLVRSSFSSEKQANPVNKDGAGHLDRKGVHSTEAAKDFENVDAIERVESSQPEESQMQNGKLPATTNVAEGQGSKQQSNLDIKKLVKTSPSPSSKKTRTTKKRKSTTFATEATSFSSNESIKSALKVQKGNKVSQRKKSPSPSFKQPDIDMDTSIEQHDPSTSFHTASPNKRQPSKSILKPSTSASAAAAAGLSSMTANKTTDPSNMRPDLMISGQDALVQVAEDNFDLDGAIDQMGSFLSTWDAEKDAIQT